MVLYTFLDPNLYKSHLYLPVISQAFPFSSSFIVITYPQARTSESPERSSVSTQLFRFQSLNL